MSDEDIFRQIDGAFDNVPVFDISVKDFDYVFQITSMAELPTQELMDFLVSNENEVKLAKMFHFVTMCLVRPADAELLRRLKMVQMFEFIDKWVTLSTKQTNKDLGFDND